VLEFDDVMNKQRELIYGQRRKVLDGEDLHESIDRMVYDYIADTIAENWPEEGVHNQYELNEALKPFERLLMRRGDIAYEEGMDTDRAEELMCAWADRVYAVREEAFGTMADGTSVMRELERVVMLRVVDEFWMEHIDVMADLKDSVFLQAYANQKPIDVYKKEGFEMFEEMNDGIRKETVRRMFTVQVRKNENVERKEVAKANPTAGDGTVKKQPIKKKKIGRNDPCPCGKMHPNGRPMKYKECCGR